MKNGYYTSGEFADKAHVTIRTIRYYDRENLLKPSMHTESGARLYTDQDLAKLQQILLFKYLGFSLDEIREMTLASNNQNFLQESLQIQKKLIEGRIEQMEAVKEGINQTLQALENHEEIDYDSMLSFVNLSAMDQSLKTQYANATNISARIRLHHEYSINKQGWFPWVYEQCEIKPGMRILEVGCGNGSFWLENADKLPHDLTVVLSDISEGMIREVHQSFLHDTRFKCQTFNASHIPYPYESFDLVIANHVLFYCENLDETLKEIVRVLKKGGMLVASTYGKKHMKEITNLVQGYHSDIVLAKEALYEKFGLENGEEILAPYFKDIVMKHYEDAIELDEAEPLISYILSCHGNQNRILLDKYKEFHSYVEEKTKGGFHITKDAGLFLAYK